MTPCYHGCRNRGSHIGTMWLCTYESCDSVRIYHVTLYVWTMWLCTYKLCFSGRVSHVTMDVRTMVICMFEPCDSVHIHHVILYLWSMQVTRAKWAGGVCLISSSFLHFIYLFLKIMLKKITIFPHCCIFLFIIYANLFLKYVYKNNSLNWKKRPF